MWIYFNDLCVFAQDYWLIYDNNHNFIIANSKRIMVLSYVRSSLIFSMKLKLTVSPVIKPDALSAVSLGAAAILRLRILRRGLDLAVVSFSVSFVGGVTVTWRTGQVAGLPNICSFTCSVTLLLCGPNPGKNIVIVCGDIICAMARRHTPLFVSSASNSSFLPNTLSIELTADAMALNQTKSLNPDEICCISHLDWVNKIYLHTCLCSLTP